MALNPFFLQGSPGEQRLVQELINEHLKIYGVEVLYIPRKFVRKDTILNEITTSRFDDNFSIEAYVNNYEGYSGSGDILTKFGMSLRDELNLIISRERFEDFIVPFLEAMDDNEITVASRPREGDIIYFPLGRRLFEVKFVEHEQPFYQLGKNYVYELKCELFEYEDEVGGFSNSSSITDEIEGTLQSQGYITSLSLFSFGETASANIGISSGYIRRVFINNDGSGYVGIPTVSFTPPPNGGVQASGVAITTCKGGICSIKEILLINPGSGYTSIPEVIIHSNGYGVGAAATAELVTRSYGVGIATIQSDGDGYVNPPSVTISSPGLGVTARAISVVGSSGTITQILIRDAGVGYETPPSITIAPPPLLTGIGTYAFNEIVRGSESGTTGRVKSWDTDTNILQIGTVNGQFIAGETIVGQGSSAIYTLRASSQGEFVDKYEQNDEIEEEADFILDFTEANPFGNY